MVTPIINTS